MKSKISRFDIGLLLLRLGLSAVFLWFGFNQLLNPDAWIRIVPDYATNLLHVSAATIVLINAIIEIVLGSLLAMGLWVRIVAFVLALHLIPITIEMGFSPTGTRDFGLVLAMLALSFIYDYKPELQTLA